MTFFKAINALFKAKDVKALVKFCIEILLVARDIGYAEGYKDAMKGREDDV